MTANGVAHTIETAVQRLLDSTEQARLFGLHVYQPATRSEDDWIYIVVVPATPGIHASKFVEILGQVEAQVRKDAEKKEILLVPASQ